MEMAKRSILHTRNDDISRLALDGQYGKVVGQMRDNVIFSILDDLASAVVISDIIEKTEECCDNGGATCCIIFCGLYICVGTCCGKDKANDALETGIHKGFEGCCCLVEKCGAHCCGKG